MISQSSFAWISCRVYILAYDGDARSHEGNPCPLFRAKLPEGEVVTPPRLGLETFSFSRYLVPSFLRLHQINDDENSFATEAQARAVIASLAASSSSSSSFCSFCYFTWLENDAVLAYSSLDSITSRWLDRPLFSRIVYISPLHRVRRLVKPVCSRCGKKNGGQPVHQRINDYYRCLVLLSRTFLKFLFHSRKDIFFCRLRIAKIVISCKKEI